MAGENVGSIFYTVDVETQQTLDAQKRLDKGFDSMQKSMDKTDAAAGRAEKGIDKLGKSAGSAANKSAGLTSKLTPLASAIAGVVTIQTLVNLQQMAERFNLLQSRITRLSADTQEAAATYRALLNISSQTGAAVGDTVQLWESLTGTLKEMGQTNDQVLRLTATLQKIGTLGGTSANDMSNALRQLGQGLAGGIIRAEEFNSVLEGMPELARQIAKGLGIPFSELRQRMLDGQLTAEDVLSAIEKRTADVDAEFAKIPRTVAQATNAIINEFGAAIATIDKATGSSNLLAKALDAVARGIRLTSGNLTDQERLNVLFSDRVKLQGQLATIDKGFLKNSSEANRLREELKQIEMEMLAIQDRRIAQQKKEAAGAPTVTGEAPTASESGKKALASMREQLELAKLQGEARARLAAIQKLGAEATSEEKEEAGRLAAEIYRLNEAQKQARGGRERLTKAQRDAKKTAEELAAAQAQDVKVITDMAEALYQASLGATDLAMRQAELLLSDYATPEQIAQVKALAVELQKAQDIKSRRAEFGDTTQEVTTKITGQVDPLSGGMFDDQTARYQAEADAENQRYADQLARLQEAKTLQLEVVGGYQALEAQMAQTHADRLAQIETAKNQTMLTAGQQTFDALASATAQFAGEQSGLYKVMFAASKAFAIAQSIVAIQQGIAMAAANPFPANLAAMASVAAATAGLVSNISSVAMTGRALGGPVQANSMYRVNETGAPEIFNAANGRQYMMPNQRGEVVSNSDATGGGKRSINITFNQSSGITNAKEARAASAQTRRDILMAIRASERYT